MSSSDVNDYLRDVAGDDFTAKDFRTWAATVLAAWALNEFAEFDSDATAKRNITQAIKKVARRLGNTPTVCRQSYVHPEVLNAYLDGALVQVKGSAKPRPERPSRSRPLWFKAFALRLVQARVPCRTLEARSIDRR